MWDYTANFDDKSRPYNRPSIYSIKIGRICFTCKYRVKTIGAFVICKYNNRSKPIWEKAHCAKWRITPDSRKLRTYEKYTDLFNLTDRRTRSKLYPKNTKANVLSKAPIKIGRCCFLCEKRTIKNRSMVYCEDRSAEVWEKACCGRFRLTEDPIRLEQYKKYMNKSGIDTFGNKWIKG